LNERLRTKAIAADALRPVWPVQFRSNPQAMTRSLLLLAVAAMGAPLVAAAAPASSAADKGVPALYATRAEAETAAKLHFHCTGAHKMGNQWMPCADHSGSPH
jgi:hypothetical protein